VDLGKRMKKLIATSIACINIRKTGKKAIFLPTSSDVMP